MEDEELLFDMSNFRRYFGTDSVIRENLEKRKIAEELDLLETPQKS